MVTMEFILGKKVEKIRVPRFDGSDIRTLKRKYQELSTECLGLYNDLKGIVVDLRKKRRERIRLLDELIELEDFSRYSKYIGNTSSFQLEFLESVNKKQYKKVANTICLKRDRSGNFFVKDIYFREPRISKKEEEDFEFPKFSFSAHALSVIYKLLGHEMIQPFLYPVDTIALRIPDYYDIIKKPISLWDIQQRLKSGYYKDKTKREFDDDVRLIFENALMYNAKGTIVHSMARCVTEDCKIDVGDIFRIVFLCFPNLEKRKQRKASNVPNVVCKRLGRRGGVPPSWWPSSWFTNARIGNKKK